MNTHAPLINESGEVRELTAADMAAFRPVHEVLPVALQKTLGMRRRGAQRAPVKTAITLCLNTQVLAAFKATGKGWQTRMNAVLQEAVEAGRV